MFDHILYLYGFNLQFARILVADVTPEQFSQQPGGVVNHPAWSLGHLVLSSDQLAQFVGQGADLSDGDAELFKAGSTPTSRTPKRALADTSRPVGT